MVVTPSSATSATVAAPASNDIVGYIVRKLVKIILGGKVGGVSDDSSSCCRDRRCNRTHSQSGERADQSGNQSPAVPLFGDLLYRQFALGAFSNDR
jgi:hypothetical protein